MKRSEYTAPFSSPAIVIRRVDYGEHDLILTLLTETHGKLAVVAKNAKKSIKRFSGVLELFYILDTVIKPGKGMPYLQEASIVLPNEGLRADVLKTAYASYWSEIIVQWLEENTPQSKIYDLFKYSLISLSDSSLPPGEISILFQMKFLGYSGYSPVLTQCSSCHQDIDDVPGVYVTFDIRKGGVICVSCGSKSNDHIRLQKGTLKQLVWFLKEDLASPVRIKFSRKAVDEGLRFMETFLPFHLEKELKSLKFLRRIRTPI